MLQKFSTSKEEHGAKSNAVRVHRWFFRGRDFTHQLLRVFMFFSYYNPLRPIRTFTQGAFGCTRISLPILITHDARCDPTREATASRAYEE